MKKINKFFLSIILLISLSAYPQFIHKIPNKTFISDKTIASLQYRPIKHIDPNFKVTIRTTNIHPGAISMLIGQPIIMDGLIISQIANYNLRFRLRIPKGHKLYIGLENMSLTNQNVIYIGGIFLVK